jgi:hypothetical protein
VSGKLKTKIKIGIDVRIKPIYKDLLYRAGKSEITDKHKIMY